MSVSRDVDTQLNPSRAVKHVPAVAPARPFMDADTHADVVQSPAQHAPLRPVLDVRGLTTSFRSEGGWREVVRDIDFSVFPGETVAIVGESGSGKSVTALSIMRLIARGAGRISGAVLLNGENLLDLSERRMRRIRGHDIAMIFQEPMSCLNPVLPVGDQVAEALILHGRYTRRQSRAEALRLLDEVKIPDASRRYDEFPHQLSGGMRQRVMIAMALACRPKLLIADEPTTALDVTIQAEILDLIRYLQREIGSAVLFITHDMGVVAEVAGRMLVMVDGRAVETGDTAQLFAHPAHVYTRRLLAAVPHLGETHRFDRPVRFPDVDPVTGKLGPLVEVARTVTVTDPPLLKVRNLVTRFRSAGGFLTRAACRVHAVENVSFVINAGETLALLGESGCGKSTIARSIVGLAVPDSGSVLIDGTDVVERSDPDTLRLRHRVQMIFQDPHGSLNPRMTIGAAIAEPLIFHKLAKGSEAKARVVDLLEKVGLSADMTGRYPHEFSGGQRQRICIARAMALEPRLIIADEAVSALDVSIKAQVINLLLDLQESLKLGLLFVSHDIAVVERVSHRVAVMYLGEIIEIGPRAAIFENPQHPYTKRLLSAVPLPDPSARRRRDVSPGADIGTVVRPLNYTPPQRSYIAIGPGHFVHQPGEAAAM
jgi:peptide/nickel transport system ATP-binding protein